MRAEGQNPHIKHRMCMKGVKGVGPPLEIWEFKTTVLFEISRVLRLCDLQSG